MTRRLHPEDAKTLPHYLARSAINRRSTDAQLVRLQEVGGEWRWVELRARPLHSACSVGCNLHHGGAAEVVVNLRDVTDRENLRKQLEHHTLHDELTGLANRTLFADRVDQAVATTARHSGQAAVLVVDIDDFKAVNDGLGHRFGDDLLREFAERLTACLGAGDTAARLSGDEFAVLLPVIDDDTAPGVVAADVLNCLEGAFNLGDLELQVRASIGVTCDDGTSSAEDLLRRAGIAMYLAKSEGGNRVRVYENAEGDRSLDNLRRTAELQRALERDEIVVHFQPIVDLSDLTVTGFEALVRWEHPQHGLLLPGEFLPLAESAGLMQALDLAILAQACRQLRRFQLLGTRNGQRALTMNVNLSGLNVMRPEIVGEIAAILADTKVDPSAVVIELTEGVLLDIAGEASRQLLGLKHLGVKLAVDDFGVGYSSLSYLQQFPVDVLKIDRSFVDVLDGEPHQSTITRSIIELAAELKLSVIAEGVERPEQVTALQHLGCPLAQGFYLSAVLDPPGAEALLKAGGRLNAVSA